MAYEMLKYRNYSNGWIIEKVANNSEACESWLLLPGENLWPTGVRAVIYLLLMLYMFLGIAIASDVFMSSIEWITSTKRSVVYYDEERGQQVTKEIYIWNETVANLTLMALGSSAPEILLAIIEAASNLSDIDNGIQKDSLGLFTIIGSAAYNLLVITGICIICVPSPNPKFIKEFGVFCFTAICSLWAYIWLLIVAVYSTPHVIDAWEAWITFSFFPIMVVIAYCQENGWWCKRALKLFEHKETTNIHDNEEENMEMYSDSIPNVKILGSTIVHNHAAPTGRELREIENDYRRHSSRSSWNPHFARKPNCNSGGSPKSLSEYSALNQLHTSNAGSINNSLTTMQQLEADKDEQRGLSMRAQFRNAAICGITGAKVRKSRVSIASSKLDLGPTITSSKENFGKFTFSSANYSILESGGHLNVDVIFHRTFPFPSNVTDEKTELEEPLIFNESEATNDKVEEKKDTIDDVVSVYFETREGTGRNDKDFKQTAGTLTFEKNEYIKRIEIPIVDDFQFEANKDFYIILKSPDGANSQIGEPSIARVTIIDDDEPGEFLFEYGSFQGNISTGFVTVNIIRQHGCDGTVTLGISTTDGTARGSDNLLDDDDDVDYQTLEKIIVFKNCEMQKSVDIKINKNSDPKKCFVVTLKNPSLGAKIGKRGGALCYIGYNDDLLEARLIAIVSENKNENDLAWKDQFKQAMSISEAEDEHGEAIEPGLKDYVLHFFTFFWKVLCAFIPPRQYLGAWPTFFLSLLFIGVMTAIVEQLANLLGCVVGLKTAVTGITLVALGTSLPDTFASRCAALHDEHADNSIGNVTGSNSVNVFLGLGLPWVMSSMYALAKGKQYCVTPNNLFQSVIFFASCAIVCFIVLLCRRWMLGGELGGKALHKWLSGSFMIVVWILYISLASLKAYDIFPWNPDLPKSVCTLKAT